MRKLSLIMMIMAIVSCKSASLPPEQKTLASLVAETVGENAVVQKNKDDLFALCTKENPTTLSISYIIIRISDLTLVEKGNTPRATLIWVDTYKVEIREITGMVKKGDQPTKGKIIDVTKYINKL